MNLGHFFHPLLIRSAVLSPALYQTDTHTHTQINTGIDEWKHTNEHMQLRASITRLTSRHWSVAVKLTEGLGGVCALCEFHWALKQGTINYTTLIKSRLCVCVRGHNLCRNETQSLSFTREKSERKKWGQKHEEEANRTYKAGIFYSQRLLATRLLCISLFGFVFILEMICWVILSLFISSHSGMWMSVLPLTAEQLQLWRVKWFCSRAPCQELLNEFTVVPWQHQQRSYSQLQFVPRRSLHGCWFVCSREWNSHFLSALKK